MRSCSLTNSWEAFGAECKEQKKNTEPVRMNAVMMSHEGEPARTPMNFLAVAKTGDDDIQFHDFGS